MLPICYLFFMSLSAGVALLQPTLLSATDELVKPEERPLEPTDELVKPEESSLEASDQLVKPEESSLEATREAAASPSSGLLKGQEKKEKKEPKEQTQVSARQPAGPSGFGYMMANVTGNFINILNRALILGAFFGLLFSTILQLQKIFLITDDEKKNLIKKVSFLLGFNFLWVASLTKLGFYFFKRYAWVKRHSTAFMVGLQSLLLTISFFIIGLLIPGFKFFSATACLNAILISIGYFSMAFLDLGFGLFWRPSSLSFSLLG